MSDGETWVILTLEAFGIWKKELSISECKGARSEVRKEILFEASAITDSAQRKRGRPLGR